MALGAAPARRLPALRDRWTAWLPRVVAGAVLLVAVAVVPAASDSDWSMRIALAAAYAVIGLSMNVLIGRAGMVSLGHQGLVGIGAFISARVAADVGSLGFAFALPVAAATAAATAAALGLVAVRRSLIWVAALTLAFGRMAETALFRWSAFTGGLAGAPARRPAAFHSDRAYAYVCLGILAAAILVDWALSSSKAGRAIALARRDPEVAAGLGIPVRRYRILALAISGLLAGAAGSLLAHRQGFVAPEDFNLFLGLIWVVMAVVGGPGSRAGVVLASAFFALFPTLLPPATLEVPLVGRTSAAAITPLLAGLLLVLVLTLYPGGLGGQLRPVRRWLGGGSWREGRPDRSSIRRAARRVSGPRGRPRPGRPVPARRGPAP